MIKAANIPLVFKKDDGTYIANHSLISVKTLKKNVYINNCLICLIKDLLFSDADCKRDLSCQHCIIRPIEKCKQCLDQGLIFGVLLTNFLITFECLSHEFYIES